LTGRCHQIERKWVARGGIIRCVIRHALACHYPPFARRLELPLTLEHARAAGAVALTFDDGPHPEGTPAVLEILAQRGARATFFVVGEQVVKRPQLLARMLDAGHEVALHGYRHRLQPRLSMRELAEDIRRGTAAIEDAIGLTPRLHRPPYGVYSPTGLEIVRERGMQPLLWSRWGKDWRKFTTPARIARRASVGLAAGDVVLLHDADFYSSLHSHRRTVRALPTVLARLESARLATVPGI
jgi:peptidoglycan-N-acetylglucosamine deacetylase